ncbi:MAG: hypothetical protein ABIF19_03285 [Planctomycetota bacterium]
MDTLRAIENLAKKAREEKIPAFDVAERISLQIGTEEEGSFGFIVFDVFASLSALAASVVAYLSIGALRSLTSPLMQFFTPLQEVRLW